MKNKKVYIISGTAVLICIIALVAVFTGSGSVSARVKKQIDLGTKYLLEGNYQEAVLAFEKVIRIDPKNVDARLGLAEAYIALDRTEDATAVLQDAMNIAPERPEPYISLAQIYINRGDYEKAIEILNEGKNKSGDAKIIAMLDGLISEFSDTSVAGSNFTEPLTGENSLNQEGEYSNPDPETNANESDAQEYVVEFKDAALERVIREIINKPQGEVKNTDLANITYIEAIGEEVIIIDNGMRFHDGQHVTGVAYYDDLPQFSINDNIYTTLGEIKSLDDLSLLKNLGYLGISYQNGLDISALSNMNYLYGLDLVNDQISDISALSNLNNLEILNLGKNHISDISALSHLDNLIRVDLWGNQISDISPLLGMTNLKAIVLYGNPIPDEQIEKLKKALPDCEIFFY